MRTQVFDITMSKRLCSSCLSNKYNHTNSVFKKFYSSSTKLTNAEVRKKRCAMFDEEKQRQQSFIKRIEKIAVHYYEQQDHVCVLSMNKDISTPYNCAMHVHEYLAKRSVVALVDGVPLDMHTPLTGGCNLKFLHMRDENPTICNEVFWRTGSFILGHILETAFKDDVYVELCRFPEAKVEQGSFVYDVDLNLPDWKPTAREIYLLGFEGASLWTQDIPLERLEVDASLALQMFEDNRFKEAQIPEMAEESKQKKVVLYRMGEHIDIVDGPLLPSTSHIQRFQVTALHQIQSERFGKLQRVQGIALPKYVDLHWWKWEFLARQSRHFNPSCVSDMATLKQGQIPLTS